MKAYQKAGIVVLVFVFVVLTGIASLAFPSLPICSVRLLNPFSPTLDSIPLGESYSRALVALLPWAILSPWPLVELSFVGTCTEAALGMLGFYPFLGVPIFTLLYSALIFWLIRSVRRTSRVKTSAIFLALWVAYVGFGAYIIKQIYIDPPLRFNAILKRLAGVTQGQPFPPGAEMGWGQDDLIVERDWNADRSTPFRRKKETALKIAYDGDVVYLFVLRRLRSIPIFEKELRLACEDMSFLRAELERVADGWWRCAVSGFVGENRLGAEMPEMMVREFGFLDSGHRLFPAYGCFVPAERSGSSFLAYYRAPHRFRRWTGPALARAGRYNKTCMATRRGQGIWIDAPRPGYRDDRREWLERLGAFSAR